MAANEKHCVLYSILGSWFLLVKVRGHNKYQQNDETINERTHQRTKRTKKSKKKIATANSAAAVLTKQREAILIGW